MSETKEVRDLSGRSGGATWIDGDTGLVWKLSAEVMVLESWKVLGGARTCQPWVVPEVGTGLAQQGTSCRRDRCEYEDVQVQAGNHVARKRGWESAEMESWRREARSGTMRWDFYVNTGTAWGDRTVTAVTNDEIVWEGRFCLTRLKPSRSALCREFRILQNDKVFLKAAVDNKWRIMLEHNSDQQALFGAAEDMP